MFETPIIGFDAAHGALDLAGLPVLFDKDEFEGTQIAIRNLARDLESVTGKPSALLTTTEGQSPVDGVILVGSLARCAFLRALGREGARRVRSLEGRWETFSTHVEDSPWAFARRVFVLAGSDKRGAIFASYTLTEQAGVSPYVRTRNLEGFLLCFFRLGKNQIKRICSRLTCRKDGTGGPMFPSRSTRMCMPCLSPPSTANQASSTAESSSTMRRRPSPPGCTTSTA